MLKRTMLALSVALLTLTVFAQAQESATLVLRSGDRISGDLLDLGGVGFTIKVSGTERQIPTGDVAVIEFSGGAMSDADWAKVPSGQPVVWLKNGDIINGQLYDIGGTRPLKITVRTANGEREFSSNEIGRIVLARPNNVVATSGAQTTTTSGSGIAVSGKSQWTSTGITVRKGEVLNFTATGEVQLSSDSNDVATPTGSKTQRLATRAPLPRVLAGALIGRIGNGQPFGIGSPASVPMPDSGVLYLGINDDDVNDNQGEFRVEIVRATTRR